MPLRTQNRQRHHQKRLTLSNGNSLVYEEKTHIVTLKEYFLKDLQDIL